MRVGLDTSVLLRLLIGEPEEQAEAAVEAVEAWRAEGSSIVISRLVLTETYYALQHHYGVSKGHAIRQLGAVVASPWVARDELAVDVLSRPRLASSKPGFVDRLIHREYLRGLGVDRLATFEKAAAKLDGVSVLAS